MTRHRRDTTHRLPASRHASSVPLLLQQIQALGLPTPETEFRFHPTRKWRADVAFVEQRLLVEVEGGIYVQGRHSRGAGMEADLEKYAEAACNDFRVLRVSPRQIKQGVAVGWILRALKLGNVLNVSEWKKSLKEGSLHV